MHLALTLLQDLEHLCPSIWYPLELRNILKTEQIDIMFLTVPKDYQIEGYDLEDKQPNKNCMFDQARRNANVKVRTDLKSEDFPSVWIEHSDSKLQKTNITG